MADLLKKLKQYNSITDAFGIARRYFVNNFYDGNLTVLGVLLGFFVIIIRDPFNATIESNYVILTGLGTAISMLISGISGSFLSERAELRKEKIELEKAMGIYERFSETPVENRPSKEEIRKAMLLPIEKKKVKDDKEKKETKDGKKLVIKSNLNQKKVKTLHEKANNFAGFFVSFVNGLSPFLGGIVPIIPFFFVIEAGLIVFLFAFFIILICIIFLGVFLGKISKDSILKNTLQMAGFFLLTILITIVFLGF